MASDVRVRFAPSPTGPLHMGGVRTALYNYLFAKKHNGTFILRVEDTDQTRFVQGAEEYIKESLEWCGLTPDESPWNPGEYGPYRQSDRKGLYKKYADQLIESGFAYYAFDTSSDLEEMREKAKLAKMPNWQYNNITRNSMKNSLTLSEDEVRKKLENQEPYVIRIKFPRNEEVRFHDEIRGWVVVNTANLDDKVIYKSDGMPTYHLANIVDDHLMKITDVIRGEEWLPSAPLHVMLYKCLGWQETMPKFAHLPLILRPDGNGKLSKRDGDRLGFPVFPIDWEDPKTKEKSSGYRERGYYPQAFVNMLAFLGWNPGTSQEVFSLEELIDAFSLERVGKAGAKFDAVKTVWFNQQYLKLESDVNLTAKLQPVAEEQGLNLSPEALEKVVNLMRERASFDEDILNEGVYLFKAPTSYDEKVIQKRWKPDVSEHLKVLTTQFEQSNFLAHELETIFKAYLEAHGLGFGKLGQPLRVAVTGVAAGPGLFEIMEVLGKTETINRLNNAFTALD